MREVVLPGTAFPHAQPPAGRANAGFIPGSAVPAVSPSGPPRRRRERPRRGGPAPAARGGARRRGPGGGRRERAGLTPFSPPPVSFLPVSGGAAGAGATAAGAGATAAGAGA